MRSPSRALVAAALLLPAAAAAAPPGLVVAVDTSRSLRPAELAAATALAAGALAELPAETPTRVVAFDDQPRWLLEEPASPQAAAATLGSLTPAGDYTLLHDALFTAMRTLRDGGTVVLLSDGRDENSATTLEDVARLSAERGVSVLTVGLGRRVEQRVLRRLAMLTGGSYLGAAEALDAPHLAAATSGALSAAGEQRRAAARQARASDGQAAVAGATSANAAAAPAASATSAAAAPPTSTRWWLLALPVAALAVGAPVVLWARRRQGKEATTWCRRCGAEYAADQECPSCAEAALQLRLRNRETTRLEDTAELRLDEAMAAMSAAKSEPGGIEETRVLVDQSLLLVREPGESPRSYLLRSDGAFAVGRDPRANTLPLRDPALSAHHLKVVPEEGWYYVVDLDSTNGTFVNQRRVRAARLSSGDVVRAGQIELEFRTYLGRVA
jgi:hypothetical protein